MIVMACVRVSNLVRHSVLAVEPERIEKRIAIATHVSVSASSGFRVSPFRPIVQFKKKERV
jgi:hypothetical protein